MRSIKYPANSASQRAKKSFSRREQESAEEMTMKLSFSIKIDLNAQMVLYYDLRNAHFSISFQLAFLPYIKIPVR
jgi:hypothetical protein